MVVIGHVCGLLMHAIWTVTLLHTLLSHCAVGPGHSEVGCVEGTGAPAFGDLPHPAWCCHRPALVVEDQCLAQRVGARHEVHAPGV